MRTGGTSSPLWFSDGLDGRALGRVSILGTWVPHFLEQATNNDHFMDRQSLLRSLAGSVETLLAERETSCTNPHSSVIG